MSEKQAEYDVGEIWKDVIGYEGKYMVSNLGRVKSLERTCKRSYGYIRIVPEIILKQTKRTDGYRDVALRKNGKRITKTVHRLVLEAFRGIESNLECNYINWIKHDNRIENLEWVTKSQNR